MPTLLEPRPSSERRKTLGRALESKLFRRLSFHQYRDRVREYYDGPAGAFLATASLLSLHSPLTGRLFRRQAFDLRGCRRILDLGSGAGQILTHLLRYASPETELYGVDLSVRMLRRARLRLNKQLAGLREQHARKSIHFVENSPAAPRQGLCLIAGDITSLPFADGSFDAITCGWVVEHLPDPRPGMIEMARLLAPGGRALLFATEDTLTGALCSRTWKCRTYNREELREICSQSGLAWKAEFWFSRLHRLLGMGGILVEVQRR